MSTEKERLAVVETKVTNIEKTVARIEALIEKQQSTFVTWKALIAIIAVITSVIGGIALFQ